MGTRRKKVALGQPLPPADDIEFSADAMREWANNQAAVDAEKYGSAEFNAMLAATEPEEETAV